MSEHTNKPPAPASAGEVEADGWIHEAAVILRMLATGEPHYPTKRDCELYVEGASQLEAFAARRATGEATSTTLSGGVR